MLTCAHVTWRSQGFGTYRMVTWRIRCSAATGRASAHGRTEGSVRRFRRAVGFSTLYIGDVGVGCRLAAWGVVGGNPLVFCAGLAVGTLVLGHGLSPSLGASG